MRPRLAVCQYVVKYVLLHSRVPISRRLSPLCFAIICSADEAAREQQRDG